MHCVYSHHLKVVVTFKKLPRHQIITYPSTGRKSKIKFTVRCTNRFIPVQIITKEKAVWLRNGIIGDTLHAHFM